MQENWVDFRVIKEAVSIQSALQHYGVDWLKKSGNELRGRCPIHKGEGDRTFHASMAKNAFNCFSCGAKGNVLDFVAAMENCSVRDAALKLKDWFQVSTAATAIKREPVKRGKPELATEKIGESAAGNKPLAFELKGIDHAHPYLTSRGISRDTAERFGVGFYSGRGSMAGRIVIPIENEKGELVAYAGRSIDGSEPKYKLPAGFQKSLVLFNYDRVLKETASGQPIVLVEGFFDCMTVDVAGFPAVALMGCSLSEAQEQLLVTDVNRVIIMLDGDEPGRAATEEIARRLLRRCFVRVVDVGEGYQPDKMSTEEIREMLSGAGGV